MKKMLVICTAFSPENAIGAIRNTKLVKYLVQMGYEITVLSPELDKTVKIDNTLLLKEFYYIKHINIPYSRIFYKLVLAKRNKILKADTAVNMFRHNRLTLRGKIKGIIYRIFQEIYTTIRNQDWKNQVVKYLRKNETMNVYDYVFTGYPSLSSHLLGEFAIECGLADKWIADFRDSIAYRSLNSRLAYWRNRNLQKRFCIKADIVTYVSEEMVNNLAKGILKKNKFFYLPNGYDNDDLYFIKQLNINGGIIGKYSNNFKICYVGSLYNGKRDLSIVFKTIKKMQDLSIIELSKIKFFYVGKDFSILFEQAQTYGIQDILINMGYVSREDSLNIQNQSNLIVVNTWNTEKDKGILTGKIYECFLLKKPILAITNGTVPNSELGRMVLKSGLGISYESMIKNPDMDDRLVSFIQSLYSSVIYKESFNQNINKEFIELFNYKRIAEKLVEIIETIPKNIIYK